MRKLVVPVELSEQLNTDGFNSFVDYFDHQLAKYPFKPAFTSLGVTLTFRDVDRYSRAFTSYIQNHTNLEPGDRIALQMPNILHYPIAIYGAMRAGLVIVNTNPLYTPQEMLYQFKDSGAKAIVVFSGMASKLESIIDQTDIEEVFLVRLGDFMPSLKGRLINFVAKYLKKMEPEFGLPTAKQFIDTLKIGDDMPVKQVDHHLNHLLCLQYTGGTTGVPKGAMLTQGNLLANSLQGHERLSRSDQAWSDKVISPLPLYHIYAFTVSQIVASNGGHSILVPNPRDLKSLTKLFKAGDVTTFIGLNTLFVALSRLPAFRALDFSSLKLTLSGGMALTHAATSAWEDITGLKIVEAYGLTEASPAISADRPEDPIGGTIGTPLFDTQISVRDDHNQSLPLGESGELWVKGPQVMAGYWQRPEATQEVMDANGWLRTGDIGYCDDAGFFHVIDRAKDLIIVSGFNVYPNEVEDQITDHPELIEAAVVGVPDERTGEQVVAFVTGTDNRPSEEEVIAWLRERLAAYKLPRRVIYRRHLPKTPVGKVLRRALRDELLL
ncbi:AMP-binding protein [Marinobacterium sp. LSUCC0821]|jgi:long-chain acyl-CoA synthetase|uniref:AMP-binding protein n=1 Tax=Marinobacterium sp. LSUCC0821 TaxID=2668067 RepID=UPI0014514E97|nr:AMP-binding protein [Marinobacterium sp. LSUCC0821]QJD70755.1 AMP-binding protein [Marinobacterium sp. LSUCC0821]